MSPVARFLHNHERLMAYVYLLLLVCAAGALTIIFVFINNQNNTIRSQQKTIRSQQTKLAKQDKRLGRAIHDIQVSRIVSCRRTYEGVREIFKPFLVPPSQRTEQQKKDIPRFNARVDILKARCEVQVKPKKHLPTTPKKGAR